MEKLPVPDEIQQVKNFRFLRVKEQNTTFYFICNNTVNRTVELDIGFKKIAAVFFKHEIPNEAEVEYAINCIEDELMRNKDLVNDNEELYTDAEFIIDILNVQPNSTKYYSRQDVEEVFTKYALLSMGRSPVYDDIKMDKEEYAGLLILREIMHHLNYTNLAVINNGINGK